jgi:homoserine O-acetyltransferase/O-succinyltransferase
MSTFNLSPHTQHWRQDAAFSLDSGEQLPNLQLAYRTWGKLNANADNAVIICHALTGSADADTWWSAILGPGKELDPHHDFIVCSNVLGGCYGSSGPSSLHPDGNIWGARFPEITIRDQVGAQIKLADALGIRSIKQVIGGSLGGLQALEWALLDSERVRSVVTIAASAKHSAWCLTWNEAQRLAITADQKFQNGHYAPNDPPRAGLGAARAIAMATYRSSGSLNQRFDRKQSKLLYAEHAKHPDDFAARDWLRHHTHTLVERFDANSYLRLINAMDRHDIGEGRGGTDTALQKILQKVLVVAITTDILYPPSDQFDLLEQLPNAKLAMLSSIHGHDGFLVDADRLNDLLVKRRRFLHNNTKLQLIKSA